MPPVPLCVKVPKLHAVLQAEPYPCRRVRYLPRDELKPPPLALVVEQDAAAGGQPVALAVVLRNPVPVELCHPVGAPRIERRRLRLRHLLHLPEHLARGRLVEAGTGTYPPHRLQQVRHPERVYLRRRERLLPARRHEGLRRKVVHLVRLRLLERVHQRHHVRHVRIDEAYPVLYVCHVAVAHDRLAPYQAVHLIPFLQQQLGEVAPVLPGDSRYQC